ncbi:Hpt domain-containing protein [Vibrio harveyi]|uniref:Hpt domain-containing protein n=1 Tax=Vibrio harveyi TaxID=669 RepID=UPI000DF22426|nr:Hpt domain-containing protein [Vibrio harveyi]RCR59034.1 Hpt domain-containing protein [Vibrio harveyi]
MINFEVLNTYMDNDVDIIFAVLSTYMEDYEDGLERINQLNAEQNWGDLFLLSHSLKGILSSFGEESAVTALSNIEEHTRDNIAPDSGDLAIVNKELVTINQQITDYLSNMDQ